MTLSVSTVPPVRVADVAILLVEDDAGDELLIRACLSEAGVKDAAITSTRTLAEGIRTLAHRPGCVLLDLGLPDADGYGGVARMVGVAPDTAVIVLTGRQERDGQAALAAGAQDYLVKDLITGEVLERSIRYAMERKRAQAAQQQIRELSLSSAEQSRLERGLLPTPMLRSDAVSCATYYRPGRDDAVLGGDFYDVVETTDGRVRAIVGDVMGHGPDEAALGVHLRVAWRTMLLAGTPDEQILPTLALLLSAETDHAARWATVCDVTIDLQPGHEQDVTVRLAGHPAPIICSGGFASYPEDIAVGLPLGLHLSDLTPIDPWPANKIALADGGSMVLYTDGLLDALVDEDETSSIGISELTRAIVQRVRSGDPPAAWIPALLADTPREPVDDTAAVVLTVKSHR